MKLKFLHIIAMNNQNIRSSLIYIESTDTTRLTFRYRRLDVDRLGWWGAHILFVERHPDVQRKN